MTGALEPFPGEYFYATIKWRRTAPFILRKEVEHYDGLRLKFLYSGWVNDDDENPDRPLYAGEEAYMPVDGKECHLAWIASGDLFDIKKVK